MYADANCGLGVDFETVTDAIREGLTRMAERRAGRLHLGQPGSLALTEDERSLLQALAAAQCGDETTVHASLHGVTSDWRVRSSLASAVMTLAASLGTAGQWLMDPPPTPCLPPAALLVARHHGTDIGTIQVSWPQPCRG
jgi:hypothetical protein